MNRSAAHHAARRFGSSIRSAIALLCLVCIAAPAANAQDAPLPNQVPEALRGMELQNHLGAMLPLDLPFNDSAGKRVRLEDFFDGERPVIIVMMYLRCPLQCPTVMRETFNALNKIDFTLGDDYRVLAVSFDARDTPAQAEIERQATLLSYARPIPRSDAVAYLTGTRDSGKALAEALGYPYSFQAKSGEYAHASGIYVATPKGRLSRYLNGLSYQDETVRMALVEASEGRVGNVIDRFVQWCYHFDPNSGSYTLAAFQIMRIGATGTAVLLGAFVTVLIVKDRRRRARQTEQHGADEPAGRRAQQTLAGAGAEP